MTDPNEDFFTAVRQDNVQVVEDLISHGTDPYAKYTANSHQDGWTALHFAAEFQAMKVAEYIINNKKYANIDALDKLKWTPMSIASSKGNNLDLVKLFVQHGANVNTAGWNDYTPLHRAAESGGLDVLKYLIDQGAYPDVINKQSKKPMDKADEGDHFECSVFLSRVEQLFTVIKEGNLSKTKELMENGISVNSRVSVGFGAGWTPFHYATEWGKLDIVKYIFENYKPSVDIRDHKNWTPFHLATRKGHLDVSRYLLDQGADIDAVGWSSWTSLHRAAEGGHYEMVKFLIAHGIQYNPKNINSKVPLDIASEGKFTNIVVYLQDIDDLFKAVKNGELDKVKTILAKGVVMYARSTSRNTILHHAVVYSKTEMVKYLVNEQNYDINVKNMNSKTPITLAKEAAGNTDITNLLNTKKKEEESFITVVQNSNLEEVKKKFKTNVGIYCRNNVEQTPLHIACKSGSLEIAKYLIDCKADVNSRSSVGSTPMHLAITHIGSLDLCKLLVEKGANIDAKDNTGYTPIHAAIVSGHLDILKFLIQSGANLKAELLDGSNAIHIAAFKRNLDIIKYLVEEQKFDVNSRDTNSWTPLHWALNSRAGVLQVVEYLVNQGADVNAKSTDDVTPLSLATQQSVKDILQKNGAVRKRRDLSQLDYQMPMETDSLSLDFYSGLSNVNEVDLDLEIDTIGDYEYYKQINELHENDLMHKLELDTGEVGEVNEQSEQHFTDFNNSATLYNLPDMKLLTESDTSNENDINSTKIIDVNNDESHYSRTFIDDLLSIESPVEAENDTSIALNSENYKYSDIALSYDEKTVENIHESGFSNKAPFPVDKIIRTPEKEIENTADIKDPVDFVSIMSSNTASQERNNNPVEYGLGEGESTEKLSPIETNNEPLTNHLEEGYIEKYIVCNTHPSVEEFDSNGETNTEVKGVTDEKEIDPSKPDDNCKQTISVSEADSEAVSISSVEPEVEHYIPYDNTKDSSSDEDDPPVTNDPVTESNEVNTIVTEVTDSQTTEYVSHDRRWRTSMAQENVSKSLPATYSYGIESEYSSTSVGFQYFNLHAFVHVPKAVFYMPVVSVIGTLSLLDTIVRKYTGVKHERHCEEVKVSYSLAEIAHIAWLVDGYIQESAHDTGFPVDQLDVDIIELQNIISNNMDNDDIIDVIGRYILKVKNPSYREENFNEFFKVYNEKLMMKFKKTEFS